MPKTVEKWRCLIENCPLGNPTFDTKEEAKEHIRKYHRNKIDEQLAKLKSRSIENLVKRGISPKEWACGVVAAQGMIKKEV